MKLRKITEKKDTRVKTNLMLFLLFCVLTLCLSVGYSALNEELNISGEASFRVEEEIRITNVELLETTNLGLENYTSKYGKDNITLGVVLPNIESTVTYKVEIVNSGTVAMWIDSITQDINNNANMEYSLEGLGVKELINPGETKEFNLTIKYKDGITLPSNASLDTILRFNFVKPVSTLAGGSSSSSTSYKFFNSGPLTRNDVETITFLPTLEIGEGAIGYWDASASKNGTVIAWYTDNDNNDLYELNIGGIGEVYAPASSNYLFYAFTKLESIDFGECFNTTNTTDMQSMFSGCTSLISLDVSNFNTANVLSMKNMFGTRSMTAKYALKSLDISSFDTSKVTDMSGMFSGLVNLESLDVSNFNTENVTNMSWMFQGCILLTNLDVSNFDTSNVTDMSRMFYYWYSSMALEAIDVSGFNTSKVTDMSGMFFGCSKVKEIDVSNFDTSNVTNMAGMFHNCSSLIELDLSNFDTSNVLYFSENKVSQYTGGMFHNCSSLIELDLNHFDTSNVTDLKSIFWNCKALTELNVDKWNTENVTNSGSTSYGMFSACAKLTTLDLSNWNTSKMENMREMFNGCYSLKKLDIRNFSFESVTNSSNMFNNVPNNISIYVKDESAKEFILNLKNNANIIIVDPI